MSTPSPLPGIDKPLSPEEEKGLYTFAERMKTEAKESDPAYLLGHAMLRLLGALKTERQANHDERDEWSRAAEVLGLAPYGGAYNPKHVLPRIQAALQWDDGPLPEDEAIDAAFPTRSGKHKTYGEAMRLVGARRSKGALVALVNWLLVERDAAYEKAAREAT